MQMKKWMKKGIAAAAAGTMALGLAACGNSGDAGQSGSEMKIGNEIIKDEITLQVSASKGKMQDYITAVTEIYNEKNDANISIEFVTVASGTATVQYVRRAFAEGTL